MLNQILVLSPDGPCYVSRDFTEAIRNIDPQLISAVVSLEASGIIQDSEAANILNYEGNWDNFQLKFRKSHNYISCAVISDSDNDDQVQRILPRINQMVYEILGSPNKISGIDKSIIHKMKERIDLIMHNEGLIPCK